MNMLLDTSIRFKVMVSFVVGIFKVSLDTWQLGFSPFHPSCPNSAGHFWSLQVRFPPSEM